MKKFEIKKGKSSEEMSFQMDNITTTTTMEEEKENTYTGDKDTVTKCFKGLLLLY